MRTADPAFLRRADQTVLILDVVEYVRLIEEDQADTRKRWLQLVAQVERHILPAHGGELIEIRGDMLLMVFPSAQSAVQAAFAVQHAAQQVNVGMASHRHIRLRQGLHTGEVHADRDISGRVVNLASRLMTSLAGPDEIIISSEVRDQITSSLDAEIEDLGERRLKNVQRPVRAFRVHPAGDTRRGWRTKGWRWGDRPSVAVLPFRNLQPNAEYDFLGDVISDHVIGHLSRSPDLSVISRLSTTPFRDRWYEPRNVAEVLGVRYLLAGTMQIAGSRLRLAVELTEADAGRTIWQDHFDGPMQDIFQLQDEISLALAKRIVPLVRKLEMKRAREQNPDNLTAYERTLRAIDLLHRSRSEDLEAAHALLEAAIHSDPQYVAPYAWLARLHVLRVGQGWSENPRKEAYEADKNIYLALEKDPTDAWALSVQGLVTAYLHKDLDTAIRLYDAALAINPSAASAWVWSTSAYAWRGEGDEAVKRSERAIELSPFDPHMYAFTSIAGTAHVVAGNYDESIEYCRRSLRENRMFTSTHRILTISLALAGRREEACAAAQELLQLEPTLTVRGFRQRYPGSGSAHTDVFCQALESAGVPRG